MIVVEGAAAREAPLTLAPMSFSLEAGVHAIVGAPADGAGLLLAVLGGRARVRRGRVVVLERAAHDASTRKAVALVPREPALPEALTVREALDLAATIRGDASSPAEERLATLGIESLAPRRVASLSAAERHALAVCEALTSKAVRVILLEEPLAAIDARAAALLEGRVRARARDGACVVVATASPRDAAALASSVLVLARGALLRHDRSAHEVGAALGRPSRLRVVASDPRALAAALARDPAVSRVDFDARAAGAIVADGADPVALAEAVARAAIDTGVEIVEMRGDIGSLDEVQRDASAANAPRPVRVAAESAAAP